MGSPGPDLLLPSLSQQSLNWIRAFGLVACLSSFMKCEKDQLCALLASKAYEKRNKRGLGRP